MLCPDFKMHLILEELKKVNLDAICMQEVHRHNIISVTKYGERTFENSFLSF